ncbi:MAG TPA: Lrp/AsnC family transcriptional regulator [Nitrososphaera sp.]
MPLPPDMLDDINLRIIDMLTQDASRPFVDIAKELGISDATVHMRVRRLVAAGIIRRFTVATDNKLLGYDHLAFIGINMKEGSADEVTAKLSQYDEILEIHEIHGRFDLLLKVRARNLEEMREIVVNKIRRLPQITDAELITVLKTVKEEQSVSLKKDISDATAAAT